MTILGFHSTALEAVGTNDLSGLQVVLTGASSGIGLETARALIHAGANLVVGVRDVAKAEVALAEIAVQTRGSLRIGQLELEDAKSLVSFAQSVRGPVDVLIANAGVSKSPVAHLANGLEQRFATNHLGHFILAHCLKQQMILRGARIVVVSSAAHKGAPVHLDDLQWRARPHLDGAAYGESKTANILFAQEATRRWGGQGIFANAILPGSSLTGLQRYHGEALKRRIGFIREDGSLDARMKTNEQAAATSVWAATAPELERRGGLVLEDCAVALPVGPDTHPWAGFDVSVAPPAIAHSLWEMSVELMNQLLAGEAAGAFG